VAEKVILDANVLVYMVDHRDGRKQSTAIDAVNYASRAGGILIAITLGEFFTVASRKLNLTKAAVRQHLRDFIQLFPVAGYDEDDVMRAALESEAGRFEFWDAVMLSAAERAGCTVCLSEDMADGAQLGAITVRNPFGASGLSAAARAALGVP